MNEENEGTAWHRLQKSSSAKYFEAFAVELLIGISYGRNLVVSRHLHKIYYKEFINKACSLWNGDFNQNAVITGNKWSPMKPNTHFTIIGNLINWTNNGIK